MIDKVEDLNILRDAFNGQNQKIKKKLENLIEKNFHKFIIIIFCFFPQHKTRKKIVQHKKKLNYHFDFVQPPSKRKI